MDAIRPLGSGPTAAQIAQTATSPEASRASGKGFAAEMRAALGHTNQLLLEANSASEGVADGTVDTVEAVLALSKAELALRHAVSMTSRALDAYREVMRLQL